MKLSLYKFMGLRWCLILFSFIIIDLVHAQETNSIDSLSAELDVVEIDTAVPLGLIINELITNAYKYAFVNQDIGEIKVVLNRGNNEEVTLEVSDNGTGLPKDFELDKSTSLGLKLVRILARQLKGNVEVLNKNGACFTIKVHETNIQRQTA